MIIDAHTHIGSLSIEGGNRDDPTDPPVEYDERTRIMDQNGIEKAVILPSTDYDKSAGVEATRELNNSIRKIADSHNRFSCGVATVEPTHGEAALKELERVADNGFKAVVWHHRFQGGAIDSPDAKRCIERAGELGLAIYIHCIPFSNLEMLSRIGNIANLTDEPIIVLDTFADPDNVELAIDLGAQHDHLYFDTALMFSLGRIVEKLVDNLGAERIIFGSDFYSSPVLYEYTSDLFQIRKAKITEQERSAILGQNIIRILDL